MLVASRREIRRILGVLEITSWRPLVLASLVTAVAAAVALVPAYAGLGEDGRWALFILLVAAGLWVTEAIPAFAVGLMVIGLEIALLGRPGSTTGHGPDHWKIFVEPWGSPLVWLFFGGLVLARGIRNSGLDRSISLKVLGRFGARPGNVLLGTMAVTYVFSMFASNTATASMMVTVLAPLVAAYRRDRLAKGLLLGVAYAANIGGMATLIGTPPNAIAAGQLASSDPVGFARWMTIGLPPSLVLLALAWFIVTKGYRGEVRAVDLSLLEHNGKGEPLPRRLSRWRRIVVVVVVALTLGAWLTEPLHGVPPPVVAFVPVTLLTATGVIRSDDIRGLEWDVLLLLAGGLALGVGVSETGLAQWLVSQLPLGDHPLALAGFLALATAVLSNLMSNTATANIIVPMGVALAPENPAVVAVPIALAASSAMSLPVSTPSNAISFSQGVLSNRDFMIGGTIIGGLGALLGVLWSSVVL